MLNLSIAIVASFIVIGLLARYLPRTSFYRRFALLAANPSGPSFSAPREWDTGLPIAPGAEGIAVTTLRPSRQGKIRRPRHRCRDRRRIHHRPNLRRRLGYRRDARASAPSINWEVLKRSPVPNAV